jgi:hypothetical protein
MMQGVRIAITGIIIHHSISHIEMTGEAVAGVAGHPVSTMHIRSMSIAVALAGAGMMAGAGDTMTS